jgi:regulator of sigma E protease
MVPRLRVTAVSDKLNSADANTRLKSGDIILAAGKVENPTYKEIRDVTTEYEDKELPIEVLRIDTNGGAVSLTVTVVPERVPDSNQVLIGIGLALDAEHPIVAKTIATRDGTERLAIPRGASITAVDGVKVSNFYDIISQIAGRKSQVAIDWRLDSETAGDVALDAGTAEDSITIKSSFAEFVPFEYLERLYKASGPIDAFVMGYRKAAMFVKQSLMTLHRFIRGLVSAKNFMGPVGIAAYSYKIVTEKPLIYYLYWLGLISAFIAVLNSLPLLPFDGGHIVFLLVEKIKGSPVSEQIQGIILYIGLVLVGTFVLYVTFNDIVRSFFS